MPGIDEVDDTSGDFAGMLAVQPSGVLLQRSFPGDRHGKNQSIQRWMIEAFAD